MKLYIVCLLVALACVAVTPAPAPQQSANVSASTFGPLTTLYDLALAFPSTVISSAQNAIQRIPFVNMVPAALQTSIDVGKHIAQGMDHTLLGLAGGRGGSNPFAALLNPLGLLGQNNGGQVGGQFAAGPSNAFNGFGNLVNNLNPLNYLNGIAQQNGQRPGGQINPFGAVGNALNNLNPINYLQGAASQIPGQPIPNANNPLSTLSNGAAQALSSLSNGAAQGLSTLSNGAAQALNQLNPAVLAQYLNGLQQNAQNSNSASNVAPNFIPNGANTALDASPGNVPAPVSTSVSAPIPAIAVPVQAQNEEVPKGIQSGFQA